MSRKSFRLSKEVSDYLEAKANMWHLNDTDTLHKLVLEYKRLSETAAETVPSSPVSPPPFVSSIDAPTETETQQPSHPIQKRSFLTPSSVELVYMKEKMRQKAKTEAMLERAKLREDLRTQARQDREEYEYALWKKRQDERERNSYRGPKVLYPGMG